MGTGRYAEALPKFEQVLDGLQQALGADHVDTIKARGDLGTCLMQLGRHEEALQHLKQAYRASETCSGRDHADTLTIESNLGSCLSGLGRAAEGLPLQLRVAEASRRTLGPTHPYTQLLQLNLAGHLAPPAPQSQRGGRRSAMVPPALMQSKLSCWRTGPRGSDACCGWPEPGVRPVGGRVGSGPIIVI